MALLSVLVGQLLFYLIILQTGIVECLNTDPMLLYPLPLGGIIGSFVAALIPHKKATLEIALLLILEVVTAYYYPHYGLGILFLSGYIAGHLMPLLLRLFNSDNLAYLAVGLISAYIIGTLLYGYPCMERRWIALLLSTLSLIMYLVFISFEKWDAIDTNLGSVEWFSVGLIVSWIFLDTALFQTLSESSNMNIWSSYHYTICLGHTLGILFAFWLKRTLENEWFSVLILFVLSYVIYVEEIPQLLAIVYPFTISYYNFLVFKKLVNLKNTYLLALYMLAGGWVASAIGEWVAMQHIAFIVFLSFCSFATLGIIFRRRFA